MAGTARLCLIAAIALPAFALAAFAVAQPAAEPAGAAQAAGTPAAAKSEAETRPAAGEPKTVCELIEAAAAAHDLPVEFFTRLLWQESTFRTDAVSPKGAQGIAQFMPYTAAERGLADPFDPHQAIPASAGYLRDLRAQFGNLGLAAAAYNAGPRRVGDWLAGTGGLPFETRDYVVIVTGREAEAWKPAALAEAEAEAAGRALAAAAPAGTTAAGAEAAASAPAAPERPADPASPPAADAGEPAPESAAAAKTCVELAALLGTPGRATRSTARAPWSPWGVQVAGNFSEARAMAGFSAMQRRHPKLLAGKAPMVVRSVNRSRGTRALFQVRVGAPSRAAADELCRSLQSAGGACVVLKTGR